MEYNSQIQTIEDFLQIYPKLTLKIENNQNDRLIKLFNIKNNVKQRKSSIILDANQINKFINQKSTSNLSFHFENKSILSINKIINHNDNDQESSNNSKGRDRVLYRVYKVEEEVDKYVDTLNEDFFLINKGIEQQKRNIRRTNDVKKAIELFLEKSELIEKVSKNYGINQHIKSLNDSRIDFKIKNRIKILLSNLANNVIIEKYEKNKFLIRKNEIGKDCYFLINGRLSILKPVEYKNIKITYEDYLKYLLNLLENNEKSLFNSVINLNWHFINVYNEEHLKEILKYYIQTRISVYSNISYNISHKNIFEDLFISNIEILLSEYKMKFEDFGLSKENIISDINKIELKEHPDNVQIKINEYFKNIFSVPKKVKMILNSYDFLFEGIDESEKIKTVTLYKYETFMILSPGAFFGDLSLENENKRRNASIRAETDCVVLSLSIEKYSNYLLDENKKVQSRQINFLCNNFFFNNLSTKIFDKYYYSMFKLINITKDNIIYEQESPCDSLFFIREGSIKYEINTSICDIHNLIIFLISELKNNSVFKLTNQYINELNSQYLKNHDLLTLKNVNIILIEKINKTQKFELSLSESYQVLGLLELFLDSPHFYSCSVVSFDARLFEISKTNLKRIISYEKVIQEDFHKLVLKKINVLISRLFNIENNFINSIMSKINSNFFQIYDTNFYTKINYEKENIFKLKKDESNLKKEEEKNEKFINKNEELILIKKFSKNGYIDGNALKNSNYSPLKFNKKSINFKNLSEIKNLNSSLSQPILKLNNFHKKNAVIKEWNFSNQSIVNEEDNNISSIFKDEITDTKKKEEKLIKSNSEPKISIIKNYMYNNLNNKNKASYQTNDNNQSTNTIKPTQKTIINIGKTSVSLHKLKKLILFSGKPKENLNLSIVKNNYTERLIKDKKRNISILNNQENLTNKKNRSINNNNEKNSFPIIKNQYSFQLQSLKRIKKKIKKKFEYKNNLSEIHRPKSKSNILAKYIKNYYNKRKLKGYSAIINPINNTIIRKKLNKNLINKANDNN